MLTYAACTAASAGIGAALLPNMADRALRAKHAQIHAAIGRQLESWEKLKADPESFDDASAARIERWAKQMARMEEIGKVEHSVAVKLADAGIVAEARPAEEYVAVPEENWCFPTGAAGRIGCGAGAGALAGIACLPWAFGSGLSPVCAALACLLALMLALAVACDMRAKVIPYQLCAAAAAPSIALALTANPPEAWLGCIAAAAIATGLIWLFSKAGKLFGIKGAIGMGDLRLMPWVCLPLGANGTLWGAVCCFALMTVWAVAAIVSQKIAKARTDEGRERLAHMRKNKVGYAIAIAADPLGRKSARRRKSTYLAMAPGLALWLAAGFALGQLAPALLHLG